MTNHGWRFFRAGGVDQVLLTTGDDIAALDSLDQKLWVAVAMPTKGVNIDPKVMEILDGDKDGRVRAPDILAAVSFLRDNLKNLDGVVGGGDAISLADLREGVVLTGARRVLANLGKKDATAIGMADVADRAKIFAATKLNGDGVVHAEVADDADTRSALETVMAVMGSVADRSGKPGVDQAKVDGFYDGAKALVEWAAKPAADTAILALGDATGEAADAVAAIKGKVDDYFTRCRLAAFDGRATAPLSGLEADFTALASKELSVDSPDVAKLPLAKVDPAGVLALRSGVNPAWAAALARLESKALTPLLGARTTLTESDWAAVQEKLQPYKAWKATKPGSATDALEKVGKERLGALVEGDTRKKLTGLIAADLATATENGHVDVVEKALLLKRGLFRVLTNYVNFAEFYGRKGAAFQAGTLYLDARACSLTVPVLDAGRHGAMAGMSATCLVYCDCTRPGGQKMSIAAAMTDGDSDNLAVGRNGIFYDREGQDWDATVTKIIDNPISLRAAFWSPYKKLVRLIEEQVTKRASAAEAEANAKVAVVAETAATADKKPPVPEGKRIDVGTVAAIGVAIGGIGTMVTGILATFLGLGFWLPVGLLAVLLLISGPSMVLAWLKLRQRNIGPILDANGWAVNTRARVNVAFGRALTAVASLPPGAARTLDDPFADKKSHWKLYLFLLVVAAAVAVAWLLGGLDGYLPGALRSVSVLGGEATGG